MVQVGRPVGKQQAYVALAVENAPEFELAQTSREQTLEGKRCCVWKVWKMMRS